MTGFRPLAAVAVLSAGVVAGTAYVLLAHHQDRDVPVPPDSSDPAEVAGSFVEALDAGDCETASAVSTPSFQQRAEDWCRSVASLERIEVGEPRDEDPQHSGHAAGTQVVHVPVSFDLDWRLGRSDGSLPEGRTPWGYRLVRADDAAPWRIDDNGPV